MKLRISFIVYFSIILVVHVFPHPVPTTTDDRNIVENCLKEIIGSPDKKLKDLNDEQIGALKAKIDAKFEIYKAKLEAKYDVSKARLNADLVKTRVDKLYYQSYLSVNEFVKDLFNECWPGWAGKRQTITPYPEGQWKTLLLNVENPKIYALKKELIIRRHVTEKQFIIEINGILEKRNEEAHSRMNYRERMEAAKKIEEEFDNFRSAIFKFFLMGVPKERLEIEENSPFKTSTDPEDIMLKNRVDEERRMLKILHISAYSRTESDLEIDLEELYLQKNVVDFKTHKKYDALAVTSKGAFILFNSFDDAYFVWKYRDQTSFTLDHQNSMVIIPANMPLGPDDTYVEIKNDLPTICITIQAVIDQLSEINETVEYTPRHIKTFSALRRQTWTSNDINTTIPVYYHFSRLETSLMFYGKCKHALKNFTREMSTSLTFHPSKKKDKNLVDFACPKNIKQLVQPTDPSNSSSDGLMARFRKLIRILPAA